MKIELSNKLPNILQRNSVWCIPACIEIALKYLRKDFDVSQQELWDLLEDQKPSFGAYKKILDNSLKFNMFQFKTWGPGEPAELRKRIEKAIGANYPVLISSPAIPLVGGWHIRVCNAIENDELTMFDPGDGQDKKEDINDIIKTTRVKGGGDILTISLKNGAR